MKIEIAPSILSADFARLGDQVLEAERAGAERIHIDVMDGHYVPNLSMGPQIVEAVRRTTRLVLEVHLMVERPELFVEMFAQAGADVIEVQVEATYSLYRTLTSITALGKRAAVALNPATPVESLREVLPYVAEVNVMTVEPGFGGQRFIPSSPDKIRRISALAPNLDIEVDGGVDAETAGLASEAGANVLVAGNAIFKHPQGVEAGLKAVRNAAGR